MPLTPAKIVEQHRKGLIRRLLSHNPLLRFRPPQEGKRAARVDLCSLFEQQDNVFDRGGRSVADRAREKLQAIVRGESSSIKLAAPELQKFLAPLRRACDSARDDYRATGHWPLVLAWPLVYIPRGGGLVAYYAPLLTWKINIRIVKDQAIISLREDGAEFNFMLQAWLEHEKNMSLLWKYDETENVALETLAERIQATLSVWDACELPNDFAKGCVAAYPGDLDGDMPEVIPSAVIGRAGFLYRPLLEDLKRLKKELASGENPGGLLGEMLTRGGDANSAVPSERAPEPAAAERWLVTEQSDPMQEESVWQARREQVMLIKGPPGTGKSQTIVNLIADAVRRGEKVALVCQKKPALDVVRKRLEEATLVKLAAQVDEPKNPGNRRTIIRSIMGITAEDEPGRVSNRAVLCARIDQNEKSSCNLPDNEGLLHSVRGDLHAKIFRARQRTEFNALSLGNKKIAEEFFQLFGDRLDQAKSKEWYEKITDFAQKWEKTKYPDNPWHSVKDSWQGADTMTLRESCEELRNSFAALAQEPLRDRLPRDVLVFAEHPIMNAHFHSFFGDAQCQTVSALCRLISDTKELFEFAGVECPLLWHKLFNDSESANPFDRYQNNIRHIANIQAIRAEHRESPVLKLLTETFPDRASAWADILLAIISKLRFNQKRFDLDQYKAAVNGLRTDIRKKLEKDRRAVLAKLTGRTTPQQTLRSRDLLRLNRGGGIPATSLRSLYHKGGNLTWKIHPVLLTNPNALCQIVPWEKECIDTVIIDEASQMFTADALPVFYRAKKVFVCGDEMQMPPSDFFAVKFADDESDDEAKDYENEDDHVSPGSAPAEGRFDLLDAVEHLLLFRGDAACRQLNVHYRSRPSELIAFSSHAFYRGKLHAAPNNAVLPQCMTRPIEVEDVGGACENRVNREEIDAVIEKLDEIWSMPSPPSVGVIAFNVTQARALYDEIRKKSVDEPDFAKKLQAAGAQQEYGEDVGFFVRSVENVQGDERDIIILSTTYSRESHNYGALARSEKGRRRLNVAITRAKMGAIVITSLDENFSHPGEDPRNENGRERWYLWMYMRYARAVSTDDGKAAKSILSEVNPDYNPQPTGRKPDTDFEILVAEFLRASDYHVDYQIGEGGFRIDLGVKRKASDRLYLCGVECDGREWHTDWRARHNDIWRQSVLEGKGWKIVRIWSDEWFPDQCKGGEMLLERIDNVVQAANGALR